MRLDELLARLQGVKKSGSNHSAKCPAHEDRNASLSVAEGDAGILLTCHAGCSFEAICAALWLEPRDLFYESSPAEGLTPRASREEEARDEPPVAARVGGAGAFDARIAATYDYVDEAGELLFQAVRLKDPKGFRQRRRDGDGWAWNLEGVRRVPYRLPAVLEAARDGRAVWVAEGEKDVEALESLGFVATCNPMGAGSWDDNYASHLKGVPWAIVVADCEQAGRKHAHAVAASLHAAGVKCKVIDLAARRDDGYDVSDFALEHGDEAKARLEAMARTTPAWPKNKPLRAPVVSAREFRESVGEYDPTREYLGPFFYGGERVHIIGQVNHGKTTLMQEALSCALHGHEFLGTWKGKGAPLSGVYIDLEQPAHKLHQGLEDARLYDPSLADRFGVWHEPEGLAIDQNQQHREMLLDLVERYDIVCIDPWYKLIAEELTDGMRNVRPVISFLDGIRKRYTDTVVVLGRHTNEKDAGQKLTLADASGYKAYERAADITLGFQRLGGDRSRLIWLKTRSHLLPKIGETWLVEWTRGEGFRRVERRKATDELLPFLTDEWQTTSEIAEEWGKSRSFTSETLSRLLWEGRVEASGGDGGGRGNQRMWRIANADQEAMDLAA